MHLGRPEFWVNFRPLPPPLSGLVRNPSLPPPPYPHSDVLKSDILERMTKSLASLGLE